MRYQSRVQASIQHIIMNDRQENRPESAEFGQEFRQESPIGDPAAIRRFITAGKAIFTIVGQSTRYTFKIDRKDPELGSRFTEPAYFIAYLAGPDNTADYQYCGLLDSRTGQIRLTAKSRVTQQSTIVLAFNWTIGRIWRGIDITPARFYHVGRCGRCGRALTVPASIESGLGPECAGKLGE